VQIQIKITVLRCQNKNCKLLTQIEISEHQSSYRNKGALQLINRKFRGDSWAVKFFLNKKKMTFFDFINLMIFLY